jgi:hypothetical protein
MKKRENTKIPEFPSLEEEREYWEARGPLAEGRKGRINKPKPRQKRSSFLAVRLTGQELTRLRDIAARQGLGPSTFARLVLTSTIEYHGVMPRRITAEQLKDALEENFPQSVKQQAEDISRTISIGNPPFLLEIGKLTSEEWEDFTLQFISSILAMAGVQLVTSKDVDKMELKTETTKVEK